MNPITFLSRVGMHEQQSDEENHLVQLSNQLALTLSVVAIFYSIFSLIFFPTVTWLPASGILTCAGIILMNHLGENLLARFMVAILPSILAGLFNSFITNPGEDPTPSFIAIQMAFVVLPFTVFNMQERAPLLISCLICASMALMVTFTKDVLVAEVDNAFMYTPGMQLFTLAVAILVLIGPLLLMLQSEDRSAKRTSKLAAEMNERNQALQDSQTEQNKYLEEVKQNQVEEKKRNWAGEGLTGISNLLRENKGLTETSQGVISHLVKYLDASMGGIFIVEEEGNEKYLELRACYAFSRQKYQQKCIEPGEGLVGQIYLEAQATHITEVPTDHLRIRSGLGDAPPRALLIVPMIANDKVEGVIELASLKPFEDYQIAFIESVGEAIASALANIRINEATQKLLQSTRVQAEELKAQEEEMRQNMEELVATQEELARKNTEAESLVSDMNEYHENIRAILDGVPYTIMVTSTEGVIEDMNASGAALTESRDDRMEGQNIDQLLPSTDWQQIPFGKTINTKLQSSSGADHSINLIKSSIQKTEGEKVLYVFYKADL